MSVLFHQEVWMAQFQPLGTLFQCFLVQKVNYKLFILKTVYLRILSALMTHKSCFFESCPKPYKRRVWLSYIEAPSNTFSIRAMSSRVFAVLLAFFSSAMAFVAKSGMCIILYIAREGGLFGHSFCTHCKFVTNNSLVFTQSSSLT